jgi:hypothetical protein
MYTIPAGYFTILHILYVKLPLGQAATHSKHLEQVKLSHGLIPFWFIKAEFCRFNCHNIVILLLTSIFKILFILKI